MGKGCGRGRSVEATVITSYSIHYTKLYEKYFSKDTTLQLFTGDIQVIDGEIVNRNLTVLHAQSIAENIEVSKGKETFTGLIPVNNGRVNISSETISGQELEINGRSLIHSAALTTEAFKRSILGDWGQYIVAIGLLLFAFSRITSYNVCYTKLLRSSASARLAS